ncbi:MAG: esterase family protein [Chitinophagaceae bacterium]|nr:MAG: esterase family protein [Chitinophagaceae bacterium]
MNKLLLFLAFCLSALAAGAQQPPKGTVVVRRFEASSLRNTGGESPERRVSIYLPPGYEKGNGRYPVLYYLHGFTWSDSNLVATDHYNDLFDKAIASGAIRPVIVVMPNANTLYGGSFYSNSPLTGNWSDFTARELVGWVDAQFRTIPQREARGLAGHSMGGYGAIKTAMLYPSVFSAVYALSPAVLGFGRELGADNSGFAEAAQLADRAELTNGKHFFANAFVAMGRAWSPDATKPFGAALPVRYVDGRPVIDEPVLAQWKAQMPLYMIDRYADSLRKLSALRFDWGRNDPLGHIPATALEFSKKLEALRIRHWAEEYIGTHGSEIGTPEGRLLTELLPFFDRQLRFAAR